MTSNLGARHLEKKSAIGFAGQSTSGVAPKVEDMVMQEVKRSFNPEFLNRLDDVIVFHPLEKVHIAQIVEILLRETARRVGDHVRLTQGAIDFLVDQGYDQAFGARPLKRAIQRWIEDPLSERILSGELHTGDDIEVDVSPERDRLIFSALQGTST
jgi:ATP-dependent Clp protease ATP-binding subunit ClpC